MVDKDVTISRLIPELDLLRRQVLGLERINAQLRADNQKLQDQIARWKRDSSNSSKPPSSDIVKPKNKGTPRGKRKRTIGGDKLRAWCFRASRFTVFHIDPSRR